MTEVATAPANASRLPLSVGSKSPQLGPKRHPTISISIVSCRHRRSRHVKARNRIQSEQLHPAPLSNDIKDSLSPPTSPNSVHRPIIRHSFSQATDLTTQKSDSQLRNAIPTEPKSTQPHVFSLADFLYKEIFGIYDIKSTDAVHQERVQNFLTIPFHLESLMVFGIFLALDSFLFIFTYLPMRLFFGFGSIFASTSHIQRFCRTHLYDVMVAWLLLIGVFLLLQVDMSRVYHAIRGQAMIKLYVLFTMIEIFDRLFCSLGQDILDSLYFTAKYQPNRAIRLCLDFLVASLYVILHAMLLFVQVVTVHVAINSSNSSLLTLLISNNFAELKSCVFKKFEEQNLFQVSCSDIVERFKLLLFLGLILLQSMTLDTLYRTSMVMFAEMVIDWLKHAFITKFNQISPHVYSKFTTILCHDLTGWQNSNTILDHTHHVSKRLGLLSLPLACVVVRMLLKTMYSHLQISSFSGILHDFLQHIDPSISMSSPKAFGKLIAPLLVTWNYFPSILIFLLSFLCLTAIKMLLSLSLLILAIKQKQINSQKS